MTVTYAWAALFLAITFSVALAMAWSQQTYGHFKNSFLELSNDFLNDQFLFFNAKQIFRLYAVALLLIPLVLVSTSVPLFIVFFLFLVILFFPKLVVVTMKARRKKQIVNELPDVLQQLAGALKAGATLTTALDALVAERSGPIVQEFSLVLREHRLGTRLDDSLENLADRIRSEDVDIVVSAILIAQDVGGNLSEILTRLAETLRSKISMEERIKSLTAQGVMQGYVVTALPTLILLALFLVEKDSMMPIVNSLLGWMFLTVIALMQITGGWFIRKIVTVDV